MDKLVDPVDPDLSISYHRLAISQWTISAAAVSVHDIFLPGIKASTFQCLDIFNGMCDPSHG